MSTNTFRFVMPAPRRRFLSHSSCFEFNTTDSELKWVESFEFISGDITLAITAPGGLGSRKVEYRGLETRHILCSDYRGKIEGVIDEAVAMRGSAARFTITELEQIGAVLFK